MSFRQLFAKKTLAVLLAEAEGDNRLRRVLGPIALTALGIGAIIGAGIFVMTGRVAALDAGPAIILSYVVAGIGCLFAALCYSEFASMAPVAGSAYTYAYTTLGELLAWIIGWDLILEYAMACACVASSWSKYFNKFLEVLLGPGWKIPDYMMYDPFSHSGAWFNLPAAAITLAVTVVLVIGIKESANTNAVLVGIKVGVVLFVIAFGISYVNPGNWTGIPPAERVRAEEQIAPEVVQETKSSVEKIVQEIEGLPGDPAVKKSLSNQVMQALWVEVIEYPSDPEKVGEWKEKFSERAKLLTAQVVAAFRNRSVAEEIAAAENGGSTSAAQNEQVRKKGLEFLVAARQGRLKAQAKEQKKQGKLTPAGYAAALTEIEGNHEATDLPQTPEDKKVVAAILAVVVKKAPEKVTEKWGLLGYLGFNRQLESIDNSIRSPFTPYGLGGIVLGASLVFFAYIGFDAISTHAEEARNPKRDVPFGIMASLGICTVLYIGVAAVITGMVPYPNIDHEAAVAAAFTQKADETDNALLKWAGGLIAAGGLAGMTSVLLITFLSQARIFLAMARDGLLPPAIFGAIHPRFRTPHISTMLTGGIIAVVSAFTPILALEEMVSIGTLMAFVIVCAAVLLLRYQNPNASRPFRSPAIWFVGPAGILVNLVMMLFLPVVTWLRLVIWLAVGLTIYFFYGMRYSSLGRQMRGEEPLAAGASLIPDAKV